MLHRTTLPHTLPWFPSGRQIVLAWAFRITLCCQVCLLSCLAGALLLWSPGIVCKGLWKTWRRPLRCCRKCLGQIFRLWSSPYHLEIPWRLLSWWRWSWREARHRYKPHWRVQHYWLLHLRMACVPPNSSRSCTTGSAEQRATKLDNLSTESWRERWEISLAWRTPGIKRTRTCLFFVPHTTFRSFLCFPCGPRSWSSSLWLSRPSTGRLCTRQLLKL